VRDDPFGLLGLPARAGLTDEEVRAAWRRIAAATHPDREDGGDPARFGAAAAAYVTLRTPFGRGEALADRTERGAHRGRSRSRPRWGRAARAGAAAGPSRRHARHDGPGAGGRRLGAHRLVTQPLFRQRPVPPPPVPQWLARPWLVPPWLAAPRLAGPQPGAHRQDAGRTDVRRLGAHRLAGQGLDLRPAVTPAVATATAAATVAAVGVTPATIGLLTGALTVSGWALWRRGGWGQ